MRDLKQTYSRLQSDCLNPYLGVFPCRQCVNCLARRAKLWTSRLITEHSQSDLTLLFCLTYTDNMILYSQFGADSLRAYPQYSENGERLPNKHVALLNKKEIQKFIKRYRKYLPDGVRLKYFVKGEYGDASGRPHYHCVFNLKGNISKTDAENLVAKAWFNGLVKYKGQELPDMSLPINQGKKIKVHPFIQFEPYDETSLPYFCKYTAKQTCSSLFHENELQPEFQLVSTHYGVSDADKRQLDLMRYKFIQLMHTADDLTDAQFAVKFDEATTFFKQNTSYPLPAYLKSTFFGGYYRYVDGASELDRDTYSLWQFYCRENHINKKWSGNAVGKKMRDIFPYLLDRRTDIAIKNYYKHKYNIDYIPENSFLYDVPPRLEVDLLKHLRHVAEIARNRTDGIIYSRTMKINKRKKIHLY